MMIFGHSRGHLSQATKQHQQSPTSEREKIKSYSTLCEKHTRLVTLLRCSDRRAVCGDRRCFEHYSLLQRVRNWTMDGECENIIFPSLGKFKLRVLRDKQSNVTINDSLAWNESTESVKFTEVDFIFDDEFCEDDDNYCALVGLTGCLGGRTRYSMFSMCTEAKLHRHLDIISQQK